MNTTDKNAPARTSQTTHATVVAIDPPEPAGGPGTTYPIDVLIPSAIKVYTNRADYAAKNGGKQPPTYDPSAPVQRWIDTSVKAGGFNVLTYHTIHLDPSFQKPIETDISVPSNFALRVNMVPDSGPIAPSTASEFLVPRRLLQPDESLVPAEGGVIEVVKIAPNPTPTPGNGSFTDADRKMLTAIYNRP